MTLIERAFSGLLGANEWLIERFVPKPTGTLDLSEFDWVPAVERAFPQIRAEVDQLIADGVQFPEIAEVTGVDQGNEGAWTTYMLCSYGDWLDFNCVRCPVTTEIVRTIPGVQLAGFSVLEA